MKQPPTFRGEDYVILALFAVAIFGFLYSLR